MMPEPTTQDLQARTPEPEAITVDRRIIELIHAYVRLTGATLERIQEDLLSITIAPDEVQHFNRRREHRIALSVDAVQQYAGSELPLVGSAFWNGLLKSIRSRGDRCAGGVLTITSEASATRPDVHVEAATASLLECRHETRRLLRLYTRLTFAAGTAVEEELVESGVLDFTTGTPLGDWIHPLWAGTPESIVEPTTAAARTADLMPALVSSIELRVSERLQSLQHEADRTLQEELARIDRYYAGVKREVREERGPGTPGEAVIDREHERRRAEETRRYQLRVEVEPLQIEERMIHTEVARWQLTSPRGRTAEVNAHRYLSGPGQWEIRCPCCRAATTSLTVCRSGHATGTECASTCSVCSEGFCLEHGHPTCVVDGQPMCEEHAAVCFSCEHPHCTAHQAICTQTGHAACSNCMRECASCARSICLKHGFLTVKDAPRGSRFLCQDCITYCEGSQSEPIGADEAALCATCSKHICERHQVLCVVDGKPHCSKHLRRADRSRRFICEHHRAACTREPGVIFASDEVHSCTACGSVRCDTHGARCHQDQAWHCIEHLTPLMDARNAFACASHLSRCHIDDRAYSLRGTIPCEICGRPACRQHTHACEVCGGPVCVKDLGNSARCVTCTKLSPAVDIPDEVLAVAVRLAEPGTVKQWHLARDGGRYVVDMHLGWTRRIVFTLPHGSASPLRARRVSILGSSPIA